MMSLVRAQQGEPTENHPKGWFFRWLFCCRLKRRAEGGAGAVSICCCICEQVPLGYSSPAGGAKKLSFFGTRVFYPSRQAWYIITTQSCISSPKAYIITRSVYLCRLDDIQLLSRLMICNSCGIDDIHAFGVMCASRKRIFPPRF